MVIELPITPVSTGHELHAPSIRRDRVTPGQGDDARRPVYLVQQGVWNMSLESMPLAAGYLKSVALADDDLRAAFDIEIVNYRGGLTRTEMANELYGRPLPDVLAFSVLGWNFQTFGALAETYKQLHPDGWVIFGGTHVANQAERVFRLYPEVDVVVNGEGELIFRELLLARRAGVPKSELGHITGISFRTETGEVRTTADRERIDDLDIIPSPILTGAIDLTDDAGRFRYDVALIETNRGCPYKCSFCYWGGATGQRMRAFSRERLRQELEVYAKHKVHTIVACDSNFGLLPIDEEFVDDLIEIREQYGYPRALETSWAKNKSKTFFSIVRKMKQAGMRSSFTLALQTLSGDALATMNRKNMKVNAWEDLAEWLEQEGLDCYAELIWGAPGETVESFMEGYDKLARHVSRIAVYPLLLLPNTEYADKKDGYGIISVRGDNDDFEYVLAHDTMTFAENQQMARFMFWARVVAENAVLRYIWIGLREFADITQSQVLRDLDSWVSACDDEAAVVLKEIAIRSIGGSDVLGEAIGYLYGYPQAKRLLRKWWAESVLPRVKPEAAGVLDALFDYDLLTQPIYHPDDAEGPAEELPVVRVRGEDYFLRRDVRLDYDIPAIHAALRAGEKPPLDPRPVTFDLYYRTGAEAVAASTNHEVIVHFMGMTTDEVLRSAAAGADELSVAATG